MVDGSFRDGEEADGACHRRDRQKVEHHLWAERVSRTTGNDGGDRIAGVIEGFIAANARREGPMADDAERYRRYRRRKNQFRLFKRRYSARDTTICKR
jgi:hypothetical protein